MSSRGSEKRFVVCIDNRGYEASLEPRKIYQATPDRTASKRGLIRIVDESGEDYLYPEKYFVPIEVPRSIEEALSLS